MIRVFRCPAGKGEYRALYGRIIEAGWTVLSVRKHELDECWLIRCARRDWFVSLRPDQQARIAKGEAA